MTPQSDDGFKDTTDSSDSNPFINVIEEKNIDCLLHLS
jgi:hypothetical protein